MVHKFDSMIGDCAAGSQEHAKKGAAVAAPGIGGRGQ
jgi:hypothetical protein